MPTTVENIEEGSVIQADTWYMYRVKDLEATEFKHMKVDHKHNFIAPATGMHNHNVKLM
jgi:uncharacterized protein YkvS